MASPSELIAHHRDERSIAEHIGAVKVIYQTLDDLKTACAELSPRQNQEFEVGVFCGKYVTPVEPGYFEHLERLRGESRKLKLMENAREAVAHGTAGAEEVQIAANGLRVNGDGKLVPASGHSNGASGVNDHNGVNGQGSPQLNGKRKRGEEDSPPPKDRMDISLHNFGDYGQESNEG